MSEPRELEAWWREYALAAGWIPPNDFVPLNQATRCHGEGDFETIYRTPDGEEYLGTLYGWLEVTR